MIITNFIFTLTWVNKDHISFYKSTPKLGFKTTIITIFIFTCLNWAILELKVFYNDILGIKNNIVYEDMCYLYFLF